MNLNYNNKDMKLACMGDIHSNYMAFEKCLEYCVNEKVDGFIFLGDYVSDCPYPQRTLELLKAVKAKYQTWFLKGNREEYQLYHHGGAEDNWHYCSSSGSLLYTYENLTEADFDFFKTCDMTKKISISGLPEFTICHGSLNSTRELMHFGSPLALENLKQSKTELLMCAHTHTQGVFQAEGKTLINPGSVGVPVGSGGKTQFAILHGDKGLWTPEFITLEYDVDQFLKEYMQSDLPEKAYFYAKTVMNELRTGENYLRDIMTKTYELTLEGEGAVNQGNMPEKYWEEAYRSLFGSINICQTDNMR